MYRVFTSSAPASARSRRRAVGEGARQPQIIRQQLQRGHRARRSSASRGRARPSARAASSRTPGTITSPTSSRIPVTATIAHPVPSGSPDSSNMPPMPEALTGACGARAAALRSSVGGRSMLLIDPASPASTVGRQQACTATSWRSRSSATNGQRTDHLPVAGAAPSNQNMCSDREANPSDANTRCAASGKRKTRQPGESGMRAHAAMPPSVRSIMDLDAYDRLSR